MVKTVWATIGAGLGWLFGAALQYLNVLIVLVIIDTIFGMMRARQNGGITSFGFRQMTKKVMFYCGSIIAANLAVTTIGLAPAVLVTVVCALIACEALSILEHARASGYLPESANKILERLTGAIKAKTEND